MTFCSSCGTKAVGSASFCHQCGFSFVSANNSDVSARPGCPDNAAPTAIKGKSSKVSRLPSGSGPSILTFTDFQRFKENDRQKHFKSKASGKGKGMKTTKINW